MYQKLDDIRAAREWAASGAARAIREGASLSLGDIARTLKVSRSSVHRWERGEVAPRAEVAVRYAELLHELMKAPGGRNGGR